MNLKQYNTCTENWKASLPLRLCILIYVQVPLRRSLNYKKVFCIHTKRANRRHFLMKSQRIEVVINVSPNKGPIQLPGLNRKLFSRMATGVYSGLDDKVNRIRNRSQFLRMVFRMIKMGSRKVPFNPQKKRHFSNQQGSTMK